MKAPKLRFKDDDGREFSEWEEKSLSEANIQIIDGDRGENYPNGNDFSENGYCLFLNAKNVTKSGFVFNETSFITKQKDELLRKGKLNRNDLIITTRGSVGNIAHYDKNVKYENIRINSGMVILRNENASILQIYIYHYFYSPKFTKLVQKIAFGSAQPQLTVLEIKKFVIGLPLIEEQTKIANFLTAIDEKITQLTQKCDLLAQYKKSVMQQIFSQKLRFKDNDDSELRTGKLKDFGYFYYGKSAPKSSISNDAKTPCVRYGELYSTYRECIRNIKSYTNISPDNLKFSKGGEVLIPRVGEDPMDFANCSYLPIANVAIGEMISVYNTKENGLFLTYYINSMLKKQLAKFVEGGSVSNLYFSYLEDIEITIPNFKEQTKIANFLTAIDDKITQVQAQLDAVKLYKKGLLQRMFV